MGVFARFRRKSEPSGDGSMAATPATGSPASAEPAAKAEATEPVATDAAAEGVDIPKQQSAEEAADSEAGEGARK
ncbi:hypothetical protein [Streptomyces sp. NPDC051219]|uniref:hypothetical protein n=1 Tax=Streptomyces sp. NPDC051219 TaxID=3155283 RepID=UPI00343C8218